ncbi:cytochrome P450 [Suillus decipiens]|nr:cytochrome P450 [Suillus decipiens]
MWFASKDFPLAWLLMGSTTGASVLILVSLYLLQVYRQRQRTTRMRGPQSPSWLFGFANTVNSAAIITKLYERWAKEYGPVCKVPHVLGLSRVVLWDPKAISHFFARDTWPYNQTPFNKAAVRATVGRGVLWADGEIHKRLDSVGIAALSHDFGTLHRNDSDVVHVLNAFSSSSNISYSLVTLAQNSPSLLKLPLPRIQFSHKLNIIVGKICQEMVSRMRKEKETDGADQEDGSCLGFLLKAEESGESTGLTPQEVLGQAKVLLLAGFETTAAKDRMCILTTPCILISHHDMGLHRTCAEFRDPDKISRRVSRVRTTPSYDDFSNKLPYLDAVVNEVLRLHAAAKEIERSAMEEDVIPLSEPLRTATGTFTESVCIPKGTVVVVPLAALNCSAFNPSRWLEGDENKHGARTLQGYRHIMTFGDGARMCLGRLFALTEFKAVLFVLVRNFVFEMTDGPGVPIVESFGTVPRPRVVGSAEAGSVPLRVRRYEA